MRSLILTVKVILIMLVLMLGSFAFAQDGVSQPPNDITDDQVFQEMTEYLNALNGRKTAPEEFETQFTFLKKLTPMWKEPEFRKLRLISIRDIFLHYKNHPYLLAAIAFHHDRLEDLDTSNIHFDDLELDNLFKMSDFRDELRSMNSTDDTIHTIDDTYRDRISHMVNLSPDLQAALFAGRLHLPSALSPDGSTLAVQLEENKIYIFDHGVPELDHVFSTRCHIDIDDFFKFSKDGTKLAYSCLTLSGKSIEIYHLITRQHLEPILFPAAYNTDFYDDVRVSASIKDLQLDSHADLSDYQFTKESPDGKSVAFGYSENLLALKISTDKIIKNSENGDFILNKKSKVLAPAIKVYDTKKKTLLQTLYIPEWLHSSNKTQVHLKHMTFNSAGDLLAASDSLGEVYLWNLVTEKMILMACVSNSPILDLLFIEKINSPHSYLAAMNFYYTVDQWELIKVTQAPNLNLINLIDPDTIRPTTGGGGGGK